MTLRQEDIDYCNRGEHENPKFWSRLGNPDLKGTELLDVGCGHGSLCIDAALSGARRVVGLDLDAQRIEFANENLRVNYPELENIVEFASTDLRDFPRDADFDVIVSKDSFEHIINLTEVLNEMKQRLRAGGRLYAGFGPLYKSVFGGHGRMRIAIPWGHLIIPETIILKHVNRHYERRISSIYDLGLNKLGLNDYKKIFKESGLSIVFFKVNHSTRKISKIFTLISRVPFLEEYFSHNIYCILEKK